mmetsp:Transcript_64281/g.153312  ORF Transcript_64281/g.153312 Transcript_64281/m.153312 type:complete len:554 (+) Transcript_64281:284-1945(+)
MRQKFEELGDTISKTQPGHVWIHYSGHGALADNDLHLIPVDSEDELDSFRLTWVLDKVAPAITSPSSPGCVFIFTLDCCQDEPRRGSEQPGDNGSQAGQCEPSEQEEEHSCTNSPFLQAMKSIMEERGLNSRTSKLAGAHHFHHAKAWGTTNRGPRLITHYFSNRGTSLAENHEFIFVFAGEEGKSIKDRGLLTRAFIRHLNTDTERGIMDVVADVTREVKKKSFGTQSPEVADQWLKNNYVITGRNRLLDQDESKNLEWLRRKSDQEFEKLVEEERSRRLNSRSLLICCEGLIACGKSTFLERLQQCCPASVEVRREPVGRTAEGSWWEALDKFYEALNDASDHEFKRRHEASRALEEKIWEWHYTTATSRKKHVIAERGLISAVRVFCKMLCDSGNLSKEDFHSFLQRYDKVRRTRSFEPALILYFDIDVKEAYNRVVRRSKEQEDFKFESNRVSLEYLTALEESYRKILDWYPERTIRIDANQEPEDVVQQVARAMTARLSSFPQYEVEELKRCFEAALKNTLKEHKDKVLEQSLNETKAVLDVPAVGES